MALNCLAGAAALLLPTLACAGPISDFSLYGANHTTLAGAVTVNSGFVGSGGDVAVGGSSQLKSNVYAGGNISAGSSTVIKGSAVATGTVNIGSAATLMGNLDAGAAAGVAVAIGGASKVDGVTTHRPGTTLSQGSAVTVHEAIGVPAAFAAPSLPLATAFSAGGVNVTKGAAATFALAPGSYGAVALGNADSVNLSAGNYFFNSLSVGNSSSLHFDLTGGAVALFVTGDVHLGDSVTAFLNGGDASMVYAETAGNWIQEASGTWFGTVYGSGAASDLRFGGASTLTGAFYAARNLDIGDASVVNLLATARPLGAHAVPEPSSVFLGAIGAGAIALTRRRQGNRVLEKQRATRYSA